MGVVDLRQHLSLFCEHSSSARQHYTACPTPRFAERSSPVSPRLQMVSEDWMPVMCSLCQDVAPIGEA